MNCTQVQQQLSAFIDGELPRDMVAEVDDHFAHCEACEQMLSSYVRLGKLTRAMRLEELSSADGWARIRAELSTQGERRDPISPEPEFPALADPPRPMFASPAPPPAPARPNRWSSLGRVSAVAIAAVLLLGIGLFVWRGRSGNDADKQLADVFDRYLAEFAKSPAEAQGILDRAYPSTLVGRERPHRLADESVIGRREMPPGLKLVSVVVRNLPCCDCVQGLYQRDDGSYLTVFEHEMPTTWDSNQRCTEVSCGDCKCRLMRFDRKVAASWKHDSRYFTVIGAHDVDELEQLVMTLDPAPPASPAAEKPQGDS